MEAPTSKCQRQRSRTTLKALLANRFFMVHALRMRTAREHDSEEFEPQASLDGSESLPTFAFVFLRTYFRVAGPFNGLSQRVRMPLMMICVPIAAILAVVIWPFWFLFAGIRRQLFQARAEIPVPEANTLEDPQP